jgi:hypothetical protein
MIIKLIIKEKEEEISVEWIHLAQDEGPMACPYQHGNEP